ncbi:extensin isoform X2 [Notothenia coriiceps]|uniref:Extensin isoform X2 n=1 Tax=Notothenia coriiceps TaxID=8208 RepID=A0A6I9NLB1_9TELE|nr:PREDICTED: extensin-like isoform X2 [Notothenia coriiceps]
MRKGLNFLGRKNQSLFDTNTKMKDMDNVELVLESSAIPESGTASVRARPTVKHHASTSDSFQGFAVPTPKVPLLPPINGPKTNGSIGGHHLSNGSVISVPDLVEGEVFVPPPPPSMAPPPPPQTFVPPPPDFMGDLNTLNLAKPSSLAPFADEEDFTFIKPPPMAPPKPPSTCSLSSVPISSPSPGNLPECPAFAPPQPPSEKALRSLKKPPEKPIRLSSMFNFDSPPQSPAPPPRVQRAAVSSFNPRNTAKLYNVPQPSILSGYQEHDPRPKQMLLLEDSASVDSAQVLVAVEGKSPKLATPSKPVLKEVQELKESLHITQTPSPRLPEPTKEAKAAIVLTKPDIGKSLQPPPQTSPQLQRPKVSQVNSETVNDRLEESPSQSRKFKYSPLIDRKLRSLKSNESNGARNGPVASPLALLKAAKDRDKHRSSHTLSRENSSKSHQEPSAIIQPSDSSPNSFIVSPRSSSTYSPTSPERLQESSKSVNPVVHMQTIQGPEKPSSPALVIDQTLSRSSVLNRMAASANRTNLVEQKQHAVQTPLKSQSTQPEELNMTLLTPPPEFDDFDDFDDFMEPPPSMPPPDPPVKKAPAPTPAPTPKPPTTPPPPPPPPKKIPLPPSQVPPPPPKAKPPPAPKLPPPDIDAKPKLQPQTKLKAVPPQLPSNLSPSQATLQSILQKKMLEMDHKMATVKETASSSDDWGAPLPEEDYKVPVVPRARPQSTNYPVVNKVPTLNMQELEDKLVRKYQESSSMKVPTSNGTQSKHQYGMTFTVRPGTKQPITLVSKGEP